MWRSATKSIERTDNNRNPERMPGYRPLSVPHRSGNRGFVHRGRAREILRGALLGGIDGYCDTAQCSHTLGFCLLAKNGTSAGHRSIRFDTRAELWLRCSCPGWLLQCSGVLPLRDSAQWMLVVDPRNLSKASEGRLLGCRRGRFELRLLARLHNFQLRFLLPLLGIDLWPVHMLDGRRASIWLRIRSLWSGPRHELPGLSTEPTRCIVNTCIYRFAVIF